MTFLRFAKAINIGLPTTPALRAAQDFVLRFAGLLADISDKLVTPSIRELDGHVIVKFTGSVYDIELAFHDEETVTFHADSLDTLGLSGYLHPRHTAPILACWLRSVVGA
jgi:hypothetical protein